MLAATFRAALAVLLAPAMLGHSSPPVPAGPAHLPAAPRKIVVGQPAPPFTLKTFDKQNISLADLRGQVIVINLWATWCAPCKAEMPMMDAYYRANKHKGLRIFGVQTEDSIAPYRLKAVDDALDYPLALQFRGDGYKKWDAVPTSYVIDRKGIVRYAEAKAFDRRSFDELLRPLLAEAPPADAPPAK